jgi:hypothetical protein
MRIFLIGSGGIGKEVSTFSNGTGKYNYACCAGLQSLSQSLSTLNEIGVVVAPAISVPGS